MGVKRKKWSAAVRREIVARQGGHCMGCSGIYETWEFDHELPLALGGPDEIGNLVALCIPCHRVKTKADVARIAKAKRQEKKHLTGRGRAHSGRFLKGKPFTSWRAMDGTIRKRETP